MFRPGAAVVAEEQVAVLRRQPDQTVFGGQRDLRSDQDGGAVLLLTIAGVVEAADRRIGGCGLP
ncbi:MAG: hypothetical protein Kilf2KO_11450 [Rhodospirillales bacterium]